MRRLHTNKIGSDEEALRDALCSWKEQVQRFRGGLVFEAHRLVYQSTLGWRVIKKKKEKKHLPTKVTVRRFTGVPRS